MRSSAQHPNALWPVRGRVADRHRAARRDCKSAARRDL